MGQQALPKPLLSGYFTNALNSVRVVNEVQKSLEDQDLLSIDGVRLPDIEEDSETVANSTHNRPHLKIKQSLTRDFSIENLKRAANNSQKKQMRTPSTRNFSLDPLAINSEQQLSIMHKVARTPREPGYGQKRQFSQPNMPFKFQQLMVKNKERLQQYESNLNNVQSQVISPRNFHQSSLLERQPLPFTDNLMADSSPRAQSTLLDIEMNARSQETSRRRLEKFAANNSRVTSATGTSLPQIISKKGANQQIKYEGSALSSFSMSKAGVNEAET